MVLGHGPSRCCDHLEVGLGLEAMNPAWLAGSCCLLVRNLSSSRRTLLRLLECSHDMPAGFFQSK